MAGSFTIKVDGNTVEATEFVRELAKRHLPFVAAASLTELAKGARDAQIDALPDRFEVRSRRFKQTFRHVPAEKRDWPDTHSVVGVLDEWAARHEEGGTVFPRHRGRFAIPGRVIKRTSTGKIRKRFRPKQIVASKRGFEATGRSKPDAILLRVGRGKRKLELAYTLKRKARLEDRLEMRRTVERYAAERYGQIYQKWFLRALT